MVKFLKIILGLVAIAAVLIVVLAIVLPFIIDPNDFKNQIATAVQENTGRTLSIDGDISLSVFPWLGLEIGPTRLSNAQGFGEQPMASMQKVQVRIKLLPLLHKHLEMDTIKLSGLRLDLGKDASGRSNWDDLLGESGEKTKTAAAHPGKAAGSPLAGLAIGGLEVTDARVLWDDRSTGSRYELNELSFTTGAIDPGKPFDLDLHFGMNATKPAVDGLADLSGKVLIAKSLQAVKLDDAELKLDLKGDDVPGGRLRLSLATAIAVDLERHTLEIPKLVLETLGLKVDGKASGTGIGGEDPHLSGALDVAEFVPRDVIKALGQEPPVTTDGTVLGKAGAALQWEASGRHVAVTSLQFQLDDTHVNGRLGVDNFANPAIDFAMQADQIDLDRYLPPPTKDAATAPATPATPAATAAGGAEALPVEALRGLNLTGTVKLGTLKAYNLRSTDIEFTIKSRDGLLRVHPAVASLYQGQYSGDVSLDVRGKTPQLSLNEHVKGIQVGPLLKDLSGDDKLSGTGNVDVQLLGSGATPEQLRRTLNGSAAFSFTNGSLKGVNIASLLRTAQAKLQGQPPPADEQPNQTDFTDLQGTATVTDGVVRNNDLSAKSPLLRISGEGQASLPAETIDYLLTTKIVGSLKGQGGKGLDELKGVEIPVRISGTFSKPTYTPDLAAALGDVARDKAKEKIEKKTQKLLKDKLGDESTKKLLKGLFP
jgi:AsmA protein